MNIENFKLALEQLKQIEFKLPNGDAVPAHFHVTEVGQITRHFIDCGGVERIEKKINFQLFVADDVDHRLSPKKLKGIIQLSERKLGLANAEVEVEYQGSSILKYGVEFSEGVFQLVDTRTACLATDACGIPEVKPKVTLQTACNPADGCC